VKRKRARFDVVSIEITVHCPHCDVLVRPPLAPGHKYAWTAGDINMITLAWCGSCKRNFQLPPGLRALLRPSTDPVRTDRRISTIAQVEVVCPNCSGDALEPKTTLLTTDGRCSTCGSSNVVPATQFNSNGKDISDANASHQSTTGNS
jgi:Zn finger protein HypA/HybF involved in hydrogenase expression